MNFRFFGRGVALACLPRGVCRGQSDMVGLCRCVALRQPCCRVSHHKRRGPLTIPFGSPETGLSTELASVHKSTPTHPVRVPGETACNHRAYAPHRRIPFPHTALKPRRFPAPDARVRTRSRSSRCDATRAMPASGSGARSAATHSRRPVTGRSSGPTFARCILSHDVFQTTHLSAAGRATVCECVLQGQSRDPHEPDDLYVFRRGTQRLDVSS